MGQIGDGYWAHLCGTSQYQDPGLEPERREAAIKAVRHAKNRDVFYLDELVTYWETRSAIHAENYMEEMLSHGSR